MKMMDLQLYREDIAYILGLQLPWEKLNDCTVLITGASGLIASCLVDVIMQRNIQNDMNCKVIALGRNLMRAQMRFEEYWNNELFCFISHDITLPLKLDVGRVEYIFQMASNTHPIAYATDPIGTITTNIIGANNMLQFAAEHNTCRFVFASSNEIYGENCGNVEFFDEYYCGYIDCNTLRAGYSESKRCGEALCQAYKRQKGLDIVISRFTRSYGPTMLMADTKAISQFFRKGIAGENIVLKSAGTQYYSYTYVSDAVAGLITILLKGDNGEAYNIADEKSDIMLKDLASLIAVKSGTQVVYEIPDDIEKAGYSTATKARLDGSKLKSLGWEMQYDIKKGVERTISMLRNMCE